MIEIVEPAMSAAQVALDGSATYEMTRVVGVGDAKALQDSELCFDQIEPGSLRGSPNRADAQATQQGTPGNNIRKHGREKNAALAKMVAVRQPEWLWRSVGTQ